MNVLILGGTGFISGEIARLAGEAGHEVVCFNRHGIGLGPERNGPGHGRGDGPGLAGDVEDLPAFSDALRGVGADIVVHSVCHTEQHSRDAVAVFGDTRLLVLGSQDCYDAFQQLNRGRETSDFPLDEDAPLSGVRYYYRDLLPGKRGQDYDKNLMTGVLLAAFERGEAAPTVFRVPMVYGPRDRQFPGRHGPIIRRIHDKQKQFVIGAREQGTIFTYGFVTSVAAAVVHAFDRPETAGRIYNVGETRYRTRRRWAELYAAAAGHEFEFEVVPDEDPAAPPGHLIVDNTRYVRETGFQDPVPLDRAIRETLEWGLAHPEDLGPATKR